MKTHDGGKVIAGARTVLFLDPIGHLLSSHDREICRGLTAGGHRVALITNVDYPRQNAREPYEIATLFGACVGDRSSWIKGLSYALFFPRLLAKIRRARPDVVVLYFSLFPAVDRRLIRWLTGRGIRTVVCAHDVLPLDAPHASAAVYQDLYNGAWRVLAFSDCAKGELTGRLRIPSAKVCSLYFGEDWAGSEAAAGSQQAREAARREMAIDPDEKVVLCFGQIKKNKGLRHLLSAFAQLLRQEPRARLLVVGRPRCDNFIEFPQMAAALGIEQRVVFRPEHIAEQDVPKYFSAADLVAIPYTRLYQSAVLPLACRFHKPIVATRVGNIPEVLSDGHSGYLVEPGDENGLCEAMLQAFSDPAEAECRGRRAFEVAREMYSWPRFCQGLSDLLDGTGPETEARRKIALL